VWPLPSSIYATSDTRIHNVSIRSPVARFNPVLRRNRSILLARVTVPRVFLASFGDDIKCWLSQGEMPRSEISDEFRRIWKERVDLGQPLFQYLSGTA
jgi:hypothetical protein